MARTSKKAIIYCRQSSGKEAFSESVAFQEEACRRYAHSRGLEVIGVFSDLNTPGRLYPSGAEELCELDGALQEWMKRHTSDKRCRPGLGEAMAKLHDAAHLLVYDITRLYRPVQNSFLPSYINRKLIAANVKLESVKEGKIDFNDFTDALVTSIKSQVNDNQIALTRDKSKQAMAKIQDSGYYCTLPKMYGIRYLGGKERAVEVIPEYAEVIRFVYDSVLKRMKYTDLLREMNTRFKGCHSGKCFYDSSWRHIIANPFYCGYMRDSNGALIKAKQMEGKEIVTFEEWEKANEIVNSPLRAPHERKNVVHPFSGLMYCGNCGSRMSVVDDGGKIGYSCLQGVNARHDEACGKSRVNINLIRKSDEFTGMREVVSPLLLLALYHDIEMRDGLPKLKRQLEELTVKLKNYEVLRDKLTDELTDGKLSIASYEAAFVKLNNRITAARNEVTKKTEAITTSGIQEKKAKEYLEMVDKVMNNELEDYVFKDLLSRSVKKIICYNDRIEVETVYGTVPIKRYMKAKYRNFPKFSYKVNPKSEKREVKNLDDCTISVTYLYDSANKEELIVDLKNMMFYQK